MPEADALVLGLDGGGTKTAVAVADRAGMILFAQVGESVDPIANPAWRETIAALVGAALAVCPEIGAAVLGLPFFGEIETLSAAQAAFCADLLGPRGRADNDVKVAFDGALAGAAGVLLLAGTGSMAWAGDGRGREARIGGWGDAFGDEGSAYWIGREALSRASRALDGRTAETAFADGLLGALGHTAADLMAWCYGLDNRRAAIAAIASSVDALAVAGDSVAAALLDAAADHLAEHAVAGWSAVGGTGPMPWTFAGGVMRSRHVRDRLTTRLGSPPIPPHLPPVGGALIGAARHLAWPADRTWCERLALSLSDVTTTSPAEAHQGN
ncbi:N-acetylglucosamine kinase [Segnochrobactrum spirostomi]|uniref:ATPase n=1 Tax=Segnochrobactrum spirostomi TaxID=2608987 RepID=A0A6A7Y7T4_9HYPH|nr:BadF/BadG/BcrA/BcrD ATPase family protein [Segnochrobactrum spirostomi]MQT15343.1 ATPase [Segnochrobactrum spirostomi]